MWRDISNWILIGWIIIFWWGVVSVAVKYLRHRNRTKLREMIHKERMTAMEKGIPLPELPGEAMQHLPEDKIWEDYLTGSRQVSKLALALGLVLIFGGVGFIISMSLFHDIYFGLLGVIPVMIGIGLFIYYHITKESNQKAKKEQ